LQFPTGGAGIFSSIILRSIFDLKAEITYFYSIIVCLKVYRFLIQMPLILLLLLLQLTAPLQLIEIIFANSRLWGCCGTIFCGFLSSLRDDRFRRLARATSGLRPRNRQLS